VRVLTVLVSPLIAAGTVYRAPDGGPPYDHTSLLATVEKRWGIGHLTQRDAAAPDIGSVLTLSQPRTDPLAGVQPPAVVPVITPAGAVLHLDDAPSHIEAVYAARAARLPIPATADVMPAAAVNTVATGAQHTDFIESRLEAWNRLKTDAAGGRPLRRAIARTGWRLRLMARYRSPPGGSGVPGSAAAGGRPTQATAGRRAGPAGLRARRPFR
jgi:phospholipase C